MSAAVRRIELTDSQCRIISKLVRDQLEIDLGYLLAVTEINDEKAMVEMLRTSNEERKILEVLEA